ncbi:MAG: sodium ion-translocating decarboxylase subunit beta, partial [Planctomycetes bacterium]|nr:sodium ion-translocating decarboxylase subunit beta [Planctomycetota bacterium]
MNIGQVLSDLWGQSGFVGLTNHWENVVMIFIACVLLYLAIVKKFEPLLLVGIAFGMLLSNLPSSEMMHMELFQGDPKTLDYMNILQHCGLLYIVYFGVKLGMYPCII